MAHIAVQNTFSANFPIYVHAVEYGRTQAFTTPELMERMERDHGHRYTFKFVIGTSPLLVPEDQPNCPAIANVLLLFVVVVVCCCLLLLLFVVCCLLFVVCCLLFVVYLILCRHRSVAVQ